MRIRKVERPESRVESLRVICALVALLALPAAAQLTAVVQPGYQFTTGERPTMTTLNLLGQPTITIQGTVSGSVGLAAKSVTGTILADSVPDGLTLDYNGASPRQLEVKNSGISTNQVATNFFGAGLAGGAGTQAHVLVDGTSISVNTNNQLTLATNVGPAQIKWGMVNLTGTTPTIDWSAGLTFTNFLAVATTTYTFTNMTSGESILLALVQDGTGGRLVTWPAGIKWRGGAAPLLTTTANRADIIQLLNLGGTVYGTWGLNFF